MSRATARGSLARPWFIQRILHSLYWVTAPPKLRRRPRRHAELCPLIRLGQRVAGNSAGESALWSDRQPVEVDIAAGFFDTALQSVARLLSTGVFVLMRAKHHTLILRDQTQWGKISGTHRIVFQ